MTDEEQAAQETLDFSSPWRRQCNYDELFETWLQTPLGRRVYAESLDRVLRLRRTGVHHYGIKGIWESIRYDWAVSGRDADGFKVNNNFHSRMARRLMRDYPELDGFFELRTLRS